MAYRPGGQVNETQMTVESSYVVGAEVVLAMIVATLLLLLLFDHIATVILTDKRKSKKGQKPLADPKGPPYDWKIKGE